MVSTQKELAQSALSDVFSSPRVSVSVHALAKLTDPKKDSILLCLSNQELPTIMLNIIARES